MDDDVDKYVKQKFPNGHTSTWKAQMMTVMPSEKFLWGGTSWAWRKRVNTRKQDVKRIEGRIPMEKNKNKKNCKRDENIYI